MSSQRILAEKVILLSGQQGLMIGTAESCTGGLLGAALTDIAGSSSAYKGSIIAYHNEIKQGILHVSPDTLTHFGAVSEQTAREMAIGSLACLEVDIAISVTGIAGPKGGTKNKPVGTVCFGLAKTKNDKIQLMSIKRVFANKGRDFIRQNAVSEALHLLYSSL